MARIAKTFASLMQELGYRRFATQGEDWGLYITGAIGRSYPGKVIGMHLSMQPSRSVLSQQVTNEEESNWLKQRAQFIGVREASTAQMLLDAGASIVIPDLTSVEVTFPPSLARDAEGSPLLHLLIGTEQRLPFVTEQGVR